MWPSILASKVIATAQDLTAQTRTLLMQNTYSIRAGNEFEKIGKETQKLV